ncbi:hypothetical protein ACFWBR_28940 [Streptomyces sp. NPDC060006]|uniref:AbiJ-related protein n=1 Tax=unclassified Streptomyces TaxID=2593676 RepID=UPI00369659EA
MTQAEPLLVPQSTPKITAVTRRDIFDYLRGEGGPWWGRLDEIDFLEGLYDLDRLASTDSRFTTARGDIVQQNSPAAAVSNCWPGGADSAVSRVSHKAAAATAPVASTIPGTNQ